MNAQHIHIAVLKPVQWSRSPLFAFTCHAGRISGHIHVDFNRKRLVQFFEVAQNRRTTQDAVCYPEYTHIYCVLRDILLEIYG